VRNLTACAVCCLLYCRTSDRDDASTSCRLHQRNHFSVTTYLLFTLFHLLPNRTTDILEKRFTALEGGAAGLGLSSGTSSCFYAIINLAEMGDNFVSAQNLYGGTFTQFNDILPKLGITAKFVYVVCTAFSLRLLHVLFHTPWTFLTPYVSFHTRSDITDPAKVKAAIDDKTRAIFCETVSNPALEISPLEELAEIASDAGIPLVVDDTFTTPYLCKPIDYGASVICHSLTKWSGGHGTGIGGIVVDAGTFDWKGGKHPLFTEPDTSYGGLRWGLDLPEPLAPIAYILRMRTGPLRNLGACLSPDNAWMFLQGIETLPLRMERHCENSLKVAEYLKDRPEVEWVKYPGLPEDKEYEKNKKYLKGKGGSLVVFEVKGGAAKSRRFIDNLKLFSHVANVGDAKSLAINPATTTHSQMNEDEQRLCGITPGMIRLSVGIETIDDSKFL